MLAVKNMKLKSIFIILSLLLISNNVIGITDQEYSTHMMSIAKERDLFKRLNLIQNFLKITNEKESFSVLAIAAKTAFETKNYDIANNYAKTLLNLAEKCKEDWNYGNAIHDGNLVLGRLAIKAGEIEKAKYHLIEAGKTPGSPQLRSFGPNMSLAKDLTDLGEKEVVIKYFQLCKLFWEQDDDRLNSMISSIKGGGKPYYGMSLHH